MTYGRSLLPHCKVSPLRTGPMTHSRLKLQHNSLRAVGRGRASRWDQRSSFLGAPAPAPASKHLLTPTSTQTQTSTPAQTPTPMQAPTLTQTATLTSTPTLTSTRRRPRPRRRPDADPDPDVDPNANVDSCADFNPYADPDPDAYSDPDADPDPDVDPTQAAVAQVSRCGKRPRAAGEAPAWPSGRITLWELWEREHWSRLFLFMTATWKNPCWMPSLNLEGVTRRIRALTTRLAHRPTRCLQRF
ncbi:hypothetical protein Cadr_000023121 [Camelus dromedarius]|uniref:Uncharacterized protein n=1 Tax=Camelus dromedarius TaxID=9838 RepID=A0A5N4CIV5_CAMDR|nr:hypothetical protein Cadr_000023121 [Camelus dromedarius]